MKVNIGGTVYEVKVRPVDEVNSVLSSRSDLGECAGFCDFMNEQIYIAKEYPIESKKKILLHEIVHAMLVEIGSEMNDDEYFVDALSRQLYTFINKNNLDKLLSFVAK